MIFNISEIAPCSPMHAQSVEAETVRVSLNGLKAFVKWYGNIVPVSVNNLTTKEGPYTYDEIIVILNTSEWSGTIPE